MIIKLCKLFSPKQNLLSSVIGTRILRRSLHEGSSEKSKLNKIDYLLIMDFEATCSSDVKIVQEIIEFPCLKINVSTMEEEARFHHYVKPLLNPTLSDFCVELTGIVQDVVDTALTFTEVYKLFLKWREEQGLTEENSLYVTSGDWDLGAMLPKQCKLSGLELHSHFTQWMEIKKIHAELTGVYCDSLVRLIKFYGMEFEGRQHSGIVDCLNIFNVVKKMAAMGVTFYPTCQFMGYNVKPRVQPLAYRCAKNHFIL